ncbi:aspartate kinase [PVC group bacterium]|nr:aspartate kinase [PVC group bacterium]
MSLIVQKYGGTSVGTADRIKAVAKRIVETKEQGHDVIVVVSAMGKTTDQLVSLAKQITEYPNPREMDMLLSTGEQISISLLAMALHDLGQKATSLTGAQIGLLTDNVHTKAKIVGMKPDKIIQLLEQGHIIIVAGFQGMTPDFDVTTLGRGGSDTSAVAVASILKAERCVIYTDVDGIYTADPRYVPKARKLKMISYGEMLELASLGAKVMSSRSIEFGKKYGVPIVVRSSFNDEDGTVITEEGERMEDVVVTGVALDKDEAKITIQQVSDQPGIAARIFRVLADEGINIDMIVQNISDKGLTDVSFTTPVAELKKAISVSEKIVKDIGASRVVSNDKVAKLSVIGAGMRSHPGVAADMFEALAEEKINIEMITTSEIRISCVISEEDAERAARAVHTKFKLDCEG